MLRKKNSARESVRFRTQQQNWVHLHTNAPNMQVEHAYMFRTVQFLYFGLSLWDTQPDEIDENDIAIFAIP